MSPLLAAFALHVLKLKTRSLDQQQVIGLLASTLIRTGATYIVMADERIHQRPCTSACLHNARCLFRLNAQLGPYRCSDLEGQRRRIYMVR